MILNQNDTGLACPRDVQSLKNALPDGSFMCRVKVHAFVLARVLDRLEALESYEHKVIEAIGALRQGAHKPPHNHNRKKGSK